MNTPAQDVPLIVNKARAAQALWQAQSYRQRAVSLRRIKSYLRDHTDEILATICQCTGKTTMDAMATELIPCIMAVDWYTKQAEKCLGPTPLPSANPLFGNKRGYMVHVPVGVVAIIFPWNYPLSIPFGEAIMGLMAGNAILLKAASPVVSCGELVLRCLQAAQLPPGLVDHIIMPGAQISSALISAGIDKIFFTGSVGVGRQLMIEAAQTFTPLSLELGGKDPAIVLADANLERATNGIAWAGFQNAGQSCGGIERVYVHCSIFDAFVRMLATKTRALRHGTHEKADVGRITTQAQWKVIDAHLKEAVAAGAIVVAQSKPIGAQEGCYPATLLTNVTHTMRVMSEETFGPLLPVMPFSTIDEAIALANDSPLALSSSVWTNNTKLGKELAPRLQTGTTTLNDHLYSHGCSQHPWGGWKQSGVGRTHGELGLREMTHAKCVAWEALPAWLIPRNMWWYPFSPEMVTSIRDLVGVLAPRGVCHYVGCLARLAVFAVGRMLTPWKVAE
eukprot:NODE_1157_length_1628_cov_71.594937_g1088_i0.p1 GENE.NODE_1157_length_1628_cov_71.594937_g1088_i0~~NODE_1157_length_1628_cov_71.594937_g1088_i0.p1  ORF type:complete len:513 (-),score=143.52 NODE_1157_length_1628_cov_71.594937_g1088_i0:88-1605(-)